MRVRVIPSEAKDRADSTSDPRASLACPTRSFASLMMTLGLVMLVLLACSPEASRVRDGGAGADPGNKALVVRDEPDPRAADTTLWPGRAPTPVDLLAKGIVPPPSYPVTSPVARHDSTSTAPQVPATAAQRRTFDSGRTADPRRGTDRR